jgi:hypothetical protein
MANLKLQTFDNFLGGSNYRDADYLMADNELGPESKNLQLSKLGKPSKRPGTELIHTMPYIPKSIYRFYKESDLTKHTLITGSTFIHSGTTQKYSGLTANQDFFFQDWYEEFVYMVNGKDGLFKYDGTTVSKATDTNINAIIPKYISQRYNRLFVANEKELWWSDVATPETFDGASMLIVPLFHGERITGIKKIYNNMVIYKHKGIMVLRGGEDPNTFSLEDTNSAYGLIAPKTLVEVEGGHVGLAREGLFFFNGSTTVLFPNVDKVAKLIKSADPESVQNACAYTHDRKIFLCFPSYGETTNDTTLVYDLHLGVFLPQWTGIHANMMADFSGQNDDNYLYFASSNASKVLRFNDGLTSDEGTAITFVMETKNFSFEGPERYKKNKKVRVDVENTAGTLDFQYKLDNQTYTTAIAIPTSSLTAWGTVGLMWGVGTIKWGDGVGMINYRLSNSSKSRYIKYKFTHSGAGDIEFVYFSQFYRAKKSK